MLIILKLLVVELAIKKSSRLGAGTNSWIN